MAILHWPLSMERWSVVTTYLVILNPIFLSGVLCYGYDSLYKVGEPSSFEFVTQRKEDNYDQSFPINSNSQQSSPLSFNEGKSQAKNRLFGSQRADRFEEQDDRFKSWNAIDNELPNKDGPVWSSSSNGDDTKSKTLPFPSLPTLDILEDPGYSYDHGRPTWPLSEYLSDKFNNFYRTNKSTPTKSQHANYEWQQLKPSPHFGSSTSGSHHNYDTTKFFNADDDNYYHNKDRYGDNDKYRIFNGHVYNNGHRHSPSNNDIRSQQAGTHTTTVSTAADVTKGIGSATETTNRGATRHGPYGGGYGYGWPHPHPGAHYFPPDHYPKKRFRLKIHPGYIAAPLAGLAAFGAASALTNKPLLFELGLVNNRHRYAYGHQYPHYYPQPHDIHYPGHGWASNVVPTIYPHVNPPIGSHHGVTNPQYPILKPDELSSHYQHHLGHHHGHHHHHHHHQPEPDKKPWWNPFAALTPRD